MDHDHTHLNPGGGTSGRFRWVLLAFLAIAGFFLFAEHRAHALGILPFALLLLCPLLHFFMHGGHNHAHGEGGRP